MTCGRELADGQWWHFCGETDMGQTLPVKCEECEPGGLKLKVQRPVSSKNSHAHPDIGRLS